MKGFVTCVCALAAVVALVCVHRVDQRHRLDLAATTLLVPLKLKRQRRRIWRTRSRQLVRYYEYKDGKLVGDFEFKNACPVDSDKEGLQDGDSKEGEEDVDDSNIPSLMTMDDFHAMEETSKEKPVLVAYMAKWCPNSRRMKPVLAGLPVDDCNAIMVYQVDIDDSPEVASAGHVPAIPTFHMYCNGQEVATQVGADEEGLKEMYKTHKK